MADAPKTPTSNAQAIMIAPLMPSTPLPCGTSIPLKLNRDNFLLLQTQLLPLLSSCGLDHILEEDPPVISIIDESRVVV